MEVVVTEHKRLAEACSRLIQAIHGGVVLCDLPIAIDAMAEAVERRISPSEPVLGVLYQAVEEVRLR